MSRFVTLQYLEVHAWLHYRPPNVSAWMVINNDPESDFDAAPGSCDICFC